MNRGSRPGRRTRYPLPMASSPHHDGHAASEVEERTPGVLLLTLPLHPPSTMTLDRRTWRSAIHEATRSYGEMKCIGLYLVLLGLGVGATAGAFVFIQWLLDSTDYALWAWGAGAAALLAILGAVLGLTKLLMRGPKRHLALVLEVRGIVLCGRCGYRVEGLDTASCCPECGAGMARRAV